MSKHTRTSRRRRIAFGLGATGGGLLAAAFMPMGIALADPAAPRRPTAGDSVSSQSTPRPPLTRSTDLYRLSRTPHGATLDVGYLDQQLNIDNSALAAQLDYDIDHHEPFSFAALDGIPQPSGYAPPDSATRDLDPFRTRSTTTPPIPAQPCSTGDTGRRSIVRLRSQSACLLPDQVAQLDELADGGTYTTVVGSLPTVPDNDPAVDFVQLFDHNAVSPTSGPPNDFFGTLAVDYDKFLNDLRTRWPA